VEAALEYSTLLTSGVALMRTLYHRDSPVVTLYVKSAPQSYHIRVVFQMARAMTPCLLVLEDIDTIVTPVTRSYFFNEVDGLENNDGNFTFLTSTLVMAHSDEQLLGILMIATTNHCTYNY
jgi:AAA+ superfamily predicted ATPase